MVNYCNSRVQRYVHSLVATIAVTGTVVIAGIASPLHAAASEGTLGCNPNRPADSDTYYRFSGWQYTTTNTLGGARETSNTYSPYVANPPDDSVSAWSMLTDNTSASQNTFNFAQVGYVEYQGNIAPGSKRWYVWADGGGVHLLNYTPTGHPAYANPAINSSHSYYTLYGYQGSGLISFQIDGSNVVDPNGNVISKSYGWYPHQAFISGETHQANDQMMGDANTKEQFTNVGYWYGGNWQNMTGATTFNMGWPNAHPTPYVANPPWYGNQVVSNTSMNIWDTYCQYSEWPSVTYDTEKQQEVWWKGTNGHLQEAYWSNGPGWSAGGDAFYQTSPIGSPPSAMFDANQGQQVVFWQGTDNNLWSAYYTDSTSTWSPVYQVNSVAGGAWQMASAPAAMYDSTQHQQVVFWKGTDGNLYEQYWVSGSGWQYPSEVTSGGAHMGTLGSDPTATYSTSGHQQLVYWQGTDGKVWGTSWAGSGWAAANNTINQVIGSRPTAGYDSAQNQILLFWQGTSSDSTQYTLHEAYNNGSWNLVNPVPSMGSLGSSPTVGYDSYQNQQLVFWKGSADGKLYEAYWHTNWNGPTPAVTGPLG